VHVRVDGPDNTDNESETMLYDLREGKCRRQGFSVMAEMEHCVRPFANHDLELTFLAGEDFP